MNESVELSHDEQYMINEIKQKGAVLAGMIRRMRKDHTFDQRLVTIAARQLSEGLDTLFEAAIQVENIRINNGKSAPEN